MDAKVNYTPEEILNIKFKGVEKGYDPLQVDEVFDVVIKQIENLQKKIKVDEQENNKLRAEIATLKSNLEKNVIEIAKLKKQLDELPKLNGLNQDNYKIMKKISAYERVLHRKGIDLNKALSDPDNC